MNDDDDDFVLDDFDAAMTSVESQHSSRSGDFVVSTLSAVAGFFGVHPKTCGIWRQETPPMPGSEGRYDLKDIVRWRLAKVSHSDLSDATKREQLRKLELSNRAAVLALSRERAELVYRVDVERWAAVAITELREGVLQLPEMLAASAPAELKNFVREETDRHCRGLLEVTRRRLELRELNDGEMPE